MLKKKMSGDNNGDLDKDGLSPSYVPFVPQPAGQDLSALMSLISELQKTFAVLTRSKWSLRVQFDSKLQ